MKNVMKRAWEIYRTLIGDHIAKLSAALKAAWAEVKEEAARVAAVVRSYRICIVGDKIAVEAPRQRTAKVNADLEFIKGHKVEIMAYIRQKEAEAKAEEVRRNEIRAMYADELKQLERQTNKKFAERAIQRVFNGMSMKEAAQRARMSYANSYDDAL